MQLALHCNSITIVNCVADPLIGYMHVTVESFSTPYVQLCGMLHCIAFVV